MMSSEQKISPNLKFGHQVQYGGLSLMFYSLVTYRSSQI